MRELTTFMNGIVFDFYAIQKAELLNKLPNCIKTQMLNYHSIFMYSVQVS